MIDSKDMGLITRVTAFAEVVSTCCCSDSLGKILAIEATFENILHQLNEIQKNNHSLFLIGNGGSAGIASHALVDFVNIGKLKAFTLHDVSLLTCMANDYGYENVYSQALESLISEQDILIAISSSGQSPNILNAADKALNKKATVITLTGFDKNNPLRSRGDINIWLNSDDYGFVELGHGFILHNLADRIKFGTGLNRLKD
ncbi:MAG TPA: SIS domain-containing protein [Thiotrichaceae bacterium]|nr:SIS domain-containing protein [Thiotrichaceae bacterium]